MRQPCRRSRAPTPTPPSSCSPSAPPTSYGTVSEQMHRPGAKRRRTPAAGLGVDNQAGVFYRRALDRMRNSLRRGGHSMVVNDSAEVRQLSQLELMGHLYRRAGFGASRDELEAALTKGYEATLEE